MTKREHNQPPLDPEEEGVLEAIVRSAVNDGDAYRDNKNARLAVRRAGEEFKRRERQRLREILMYVERLAVEEVQRRWRDENPLQKTRKLKKKLLR